MTPRAYWKNYVEKHGGPTGAAQHLDIPYPTIAAVCNGRRGIGHRLAKQMIAADPELDASVLVWVRPLPADTFDKAA